MSSDDQELVKKASLGNSLAFDELHKKYRRRILNYLYRFLSNYQLAEDVTQETFINVYLNLKNYRPEGTVSSWIYKIATNAAKNKLRSIGRAKKTSLDAPLTDEKRTALVDIIQSVAPPPDEIAKRREFEATVQKAIDELPLKYKTVLVLCEIQGLSYEEAAQILDCTTDVIGVRLNRARAQMRKKIDLSKFT